MSSKNTPAGVRLNKILQASTPKSNSSTNSLHKKVVRPLSSSKLTDNLLCDHSSVITTSFLPSSAVKTPASSQKFKPKTCTTLNACYTPSSLFRSTKSTPRSAIATPRNAVKHVVSSTPECSSKPNSSRRSEVSAMENSEALSKSIKDVEVSNLTVAVRVRPLNAQECINPGVTNIIQVVANEVTVYTGTTADNSAGVSHCFQYDQAFYSCNMDNSNYANQETVFNGTGMGLIDRAFEGYNTCLFAYGQTGSGKSYSMMGIEVDDSDNIATNAEAGIIPRFCHELFRRIEASKDKIQAEIEVSYFEIYNEKIHDLLCVSDHSESHSSTQKNALKVREHPVWGPYVVDLSIHPVESYSALRNWLAVGNSQRATAATGMNDKSSRSHSIFNIVLNLSDIDSTSTDVEEKVKQTRRSKISLVDLAGSERITHTAGSNGDRVREGVSINKSLLTLGKVISKLADSKKQSNFVPYRESVLTWLLRESLGGNSKTLMLATISPASIHIDETLATLRYACQARTIVNRVKVNEDPHDKIIRELRAEVERLQALRQDYERQKRHSASNNVPARKIIIETSVDESEVDALRQQLAETEKQLNRAQKSWMERLKEAEDQRKSELRLLKRKGLAMELSAEQKQACLVNLAADPILSGTLFYILPAGIVKIGRTRTSIYCSQPDIVLDGPLVGYHHCTIENKNGKLYITPDNEEFETYLNGELVTDTLQMFHGDRLVIGGSHYFRISNPFCSKRRSKSVIVDFQLAHQEILQKQEQQLRRELDEEKRAALSQIETERAANERNYKERLDMLELEQFKFKCNKELLETEKKALKEENEFVYTPSYKSTLLDDINRIMQHPSEESLHKTQLMVKEATQRCRQLGLQLDFKQSQKLDEFGFFHAVVLIIDRKKKQKAEWPTARLDVWLNMLRENEVDRNDVFKCMDIEWKAAEENLDETLSDSLNSSRISLNLNLVKEVMLKQPYQKFQNIFSSNSSNKKENLSKSAVMNCSLRKTKKMLTYDEQDGDTSCNEGNSSLSPGLDFSTSVNIHVRDIHRSTMKLKKLCDRFDSDENNSKNICKVAMGEQVRKSVEQLENVLHGLRVTLSESLYNETSPSKTPKSVKEATQRCRQLGLQLDFKQSQILDEFGFFHAVVLIIDRKRKQKAEWPTARLDVWLNMLRENEVDRNDVFKCMDIEWKAAEENLDETLSDSLNSSRISLNLNLVKEVMLKQPYQKFQNIFSSNSSNKKENLSKSAVMNCSLRKTKKMLTYDEQDGDTSCNEGNSSLSPGLDFSTSVNIHVRDIHRSTMKLKKLCDRFDSDENNSKNICKVAMGEQVRKSVEQLENVLHGLRVTLSECLYNETSPSKTPKSVKEATQRCRQLGLQLDFKQSQILDEFGFFHAVVLIIDRKRKQKAEWPTARLDVWLNMLRENEVDRNDVFKCMDIEWKAAEENLDETLSDSLNSSRISLNLNLVKEVMLKQPYQKFQNIFSSNSSNKKENLSKSAVMNCSLRKTKKMLTYDEQDGDTSCNEGNSSLSPGLDFSTSVNIHVRDIHRSTMKLKKLCDRFDSDENNSKNICKVAMGEQVRKSVEQLENVLHGLRVTLSECLYNETSPSKTPKSVRFLVD